MRGRKKGNRSIAMEKGEPLYIPDFPCRRNHMSLRHYLFGCLECKKQNAMDRAERRKKRQFTAAMDKSKLPKSRTCAIIRKENYYYEDERCGECGTYSVRHIKNGCTHCKKLACRNHNKKNKIKKKTEETNVIYIDDSLKINDLSKMESGKVYIVKGRCAA